MADESERGLIERAKAGDREALAELLERHQARVMRFATKMCGPQEAEGVTQDAMIDAMRGIEGFRGDSSLSSWLYALTRSRCLKRRRRSKFAPKTLEPLAERSDSISDERAEPDAAAARAELREALERAIDELDDEQREVLLLRDVEGVAGGEVAEILGISLAAMKSRLHRARKALRDMVEPLLDDQPSPACPDVIDMFSRNLEGDITTLDCQRMQEHIDRCDRCRQVCDSLKNVLAACEALPVPDVPDTLKEQIRIQLRARVEPLD